MRQRQRGHQLHVQVVDEGGARAAEPPVHAGEVRPALRPAVVTADVLHGELRVNGGGGRWSRRELLYTGRNCHVMFFACSAWEKARRIRHSGSEKSGPIPCSRAEHPSPSGWHPPTFFNPNSADRSPFLSIRFVLTPTSLSATASMAFNAASTSFPSTLSTIHSTRSLTPPGSSFTREAHSAREGEGEGERGG